MSGNHINIVQLSLDVFSLSFISLDLLLLYLLFFVPLLLIQALIALSKLLKIVIYMVSNPTTIIISLTSRSISLHQGAGRR